MTQGNSKALAAAAAGPTTLLGLGLRASSEGLDEQVSLQGFCVCIFARVLHSRQRAVSCSGTVFRHEPSGLVDRHTLPSADCILRLPVAFAAKHALDTALVCMRASYAQNACGATCLQVEATLASARPSYCMPCINAPESAFNTAFQMVSIDSTVTYNAVG